MDTNESRGSWLAPAFFKLAVLYFIAGVAMGIYMGASQDFVIAPDHAHINLLGWASLTLFGLLYKLYPAMTENWMARWHFWLFNLPLPVLLVALYVMLRGSPALEPLLGICSVIIGISVILFAINVFRYVGRAPVRETAPRGANLTA